MPQNPREERSPKSVRPAGDDDGDRFAAPDDYAQPDWAEPTPHRSWTASRAGWLTRRSAVETLDPSRDKRERRATSRGSGAFRSCGASHSHTGILGRLVKRALPRTVAATHRRVLYW